MRLPIPKEYHPFICGPYNRTLKELQERTSTRINIPPLSVMKNELTIAGEKNGVQIAEQEISGIYEQKVIASAQLVVLCLHQFYEFHIAN